MGCLKMNRRRVSSADFDSLLEELARWRMVLLEDSLAQNTTSVVEEIEFLVMEVKILKMFVIHIDDRSDDVNLGIDLEAAMKQARRCFRAASEKGIEKRVDFLHPAVSDLQEKIALFRPQVKTAYDHASTSNYCLSYYGFWNEFSDNVRRILRSQANYSGESKFDEYVKPQLLVMDEMIGYLDNFLHNVEDLHSKQEEEFSHLLSHFHSVLVRAARFSFLCWIDRMDSSKVEKELIPTLYDLLKEFKPITPQVTNMCLNLLRCTTDLSSSTADVFARFLIAERDQFVFLRERIKNLMAFAISSPELYRKEDVKPILMDIIEVICELGSLAYSFHTGRTHPAFYKSLEKMEILKAEVFLVELLHGRISTKSLVMDIIDSFRHEFSFLQSSHRYGFQLEGKNPVPIWMNVEPVVREAGSVYLSLHSVSVTEDEATGEFLKLLDKIRVFMIEIFLEELLNSLPSILDNVRNQIESLHEGLQVLRAFLMGPSEENGKLILPNVELVVRDMVSIYFLFRANRVVEDKARDIAVVLPDLLERLEPVTAEINNIYVCVRSSFRSNLPKTNGFGFVDYLLRNLKELLVSGVASIASLNYQIQFILTGMEILRSLFRDVEERCNEQSELKSLVSCIIEVAYEAEYVIDLFVVENGVLWYHLVWLSDLMEDIKLLRLKASEVSDKINCMRIHDVTPSSRKVTAPAKVPRFDEVVLDLADQTKLMIDRLTRGPRQQDIVSIVGMAGLGKTTLARMVYNDPSVTNHFHVCAWCCVSQAYCKRELLLEILDDIMELTDNILAMRDEDLEMMLYQRLKRKRYLIVIDDIWSIEPWEDIEKSFPDDRNGSRILMTSRLHEVISMAKRESIPHNLRLLSDDESWILLRKKLFGTKDCPDELVEVGKQIAKSCKGLPLAVVAISGILDRTETKLDFWNQVAETLCRYIVEGPERMCMDILELSYRNLPDYLKPCFLYLGAFVEDKEIPVRKLTWLWIAEGFIPNTGPERVENLAERYLIDLISRSLVIVSRRRSNGGVKTCRVHDMLRTLCLLKCEEEDFLQWKYGFDALFAASYEDLDYGVDPNYRCPTGSNKYEKYRLSVCSKRNHFVMSRPSGLYLRSLLYSATSDLYPRCPYDISFIADNFKLIRVLDLECINMGHCFPNGMELLVHLRYLAISGDIDSIPESLASLSNLETLIVKGLKGRVLLPSTFWNMKKLRHVHVSNYAAFNLQDSEVEYYDNLHDLVSLSSPFIYCDEYTKHLRKLPNLRKLKCVFSESRDGDRISYKFPSLAFLQHLESLNVIYFGRIAHPRKFNLPLVLRKLTLARFRLPWDCISEIGRLPYLEVLKLHSRAFEGKKWVMKDGEFIKLKLLKLDTLNVAQWNASGDNFPNLQHLILRNCRELEEVPCGVADISTLEIIEVQSCSSSVVKSVRRIEEEQVEMGNCQFKVLINHSDWDF